MNFCTITTTTELTGVLPEMHGVGGHRCFLRDEGGVLNSYSLGRMSEINTADMMGELSFVQISDSHMGFNKPANRTSRER